MPPEANPIKSAARRAEQEQYLRMLVQKAVQHFDPNQELVTFQNHPIFCNICGKTFASRTMLELHKDLYHEIDEKACYENGVLELEIEILETEIEIIKIEIELLEDQSIEPNKDTVDFIHVPINCHICFKIYSAKSTLSLHMQIFHKEIEYINSRKVDNLNNISE